MLNIFFLGLVSFFTDVSTEMIYPLIPLYLTSAFGATPALIGVIEGIAESVASLLKVYGGYLSDRFKRKKALAFTGYSGGVFYKFALLIASSWTGILIARIIDRTGKGIRVAPRDSLVSESADKKHMGKAFGMHKMLDMAGAGLGVLITYFLLRGGANTKDYKWIFMISLIPAALGLGMFYFIKEQKQPAVKKKEQISMKQLPQSFAGLDGRLKLYLLVVLLFTLGNSSNTFLLLKASAVGFSDAAVIFVFFAYHISASVLSMPFGGLSDRLGRKKLLVSGYIVFAAVYFGFAFAPDRAFIAAMFVLYGVHTAMIAGVERAFIADIAPPELKGTMLGLHSTVAGVALFPASVVTGLLWNTFGAEVPFVYGAVMSLLAAVMLLVFMKTGTVAVQE